MYATTSFPTNALGIITLIARIGLNVPEIAHPTPFVDQGGWELVAALAAGALLIAAAGSRFVAAEAQAISASADLGSAARDRT